MADNNRQVALQKQNTVKGYLFSATMLDQLKLALPNIGITPERLARVAFTSVTLNPSLAECSIESLMRSIILSAQYGVLPDGRQAHLIAYGKEVQFQFDYKGLIGIVKRDPKVKDYFLDAAYEQDEFEICSGSERFIKHKPNIKVKNRGEIICVYSIIEYKDGGIDFDYMTPAEVEDTRKKYSKAPNSPAWVKSWPEMAKKTVAHRHLKKADLSPLTNYALQASMSEEVGQSQAAVLAQQSAFLGADIDESLVIAGEISEVETKDFTPDFEAAVKKSGTKYGKMTAVHEFVKACSEARKLTEQAIMQQAIENTASFMEGYVKWNEKRQQAAPKTEPAPTQETAAPSAGTDSEDDRFWTKPQAESVAQGESFGITRAQIRERLGKDIGDAEPAEIDKAVSLIVDGGKE